MNYNAATGYSTDAAGNIIDKNGKIVVDAMTAKRFGMTPDNVKPAGGFDPTSLVTAPFTGAATGVADAASGQYGKVPGDLAYAGTGGVVGNSPGSPTTGLVNPTSVGMAGTAIGNAAKTGASAVGSALGGLGLPGGGGPSSGPTPQQNPGADVRARQLAYADQLNATINGTAGPSAADIQGHQAQDRAIAQQFAAAQGATGANTSMAYRQALQNAAQISQQAGADAATLRAKEIADAQSQLGGALNNTRSSDLSQYGTDVGAGNVRYAADKDFQGKEIAAATGAGSAILGGIVSDENEKTDKGPGDSEIAEMLDKLKAMKFRYKDPEGPGKAPGKRAGVMAQDLEKSLAGKALVIDTPEGKGIDTPQAVGAMLAALASLHARTKRLEGRG